MYHILINPASRSGKGMQIWRNQVEPALQRGNISYRPYFSKKAGDTARIAEEITSHTSGPLSLIILGGDGSINEALQGISNTSRITLGYIPTGSGNDLARDLGIPANSREALDLILHSGKPHTMDLGIVTYPDGRIRRFAVSCGMGFDAAVCEEVMHSKLKKIMNKLGLGKLTYLGVALKQLFSAKAVSGTLILEDGTSVGIRNMLFTACMLHRFEGGGFQFAPDADANDGILNLCVVDNVPKLLILFALPTAFKGNHYRFKGITPYRARMLTRETPLPLWVHTDGEVTRKSNRICVSCEHSAINIIADIPN